MNYLAGFGKFQTTCFIPGIGMMGYGQPHNTVKEVATELFARTLLLEHNNTRFILVHLEQAFVSLAIKEEILARLQLAYPEWRITHADLMITAQHTHSAPGGYTHYPFYNFTIPDFQRKVFTTICDGIMFSIAAASKDLSPAHIHWGTHAVAPDKEIAFNRSMKAYLNNPDSLNVNEDETHLAVNRMMEGLIFSHEGKMRGFLNWFGVHATSISSFNQRIHHDNKGVAAELFEKNHPGSTAFFLQAAAGDVSPNYIWDKQLKRNRGKFKDQYENAAYNGELQFREAQKIEKQKEIQGPLKAWHQFMDMSLEVAPPAHGVAFFEGTKEGPGISPLLGKLLRVISRVVNHQQDSFQEAHAPKDILLDHRSGSFLGLPLSLWKKLPPLPEPTLEAFRKSARKEAINTLPWVPVILPFQLVRLGPLLIVAVPGEITTTSASRLKSHLLQQTNSLGIEQLIITSYANAYMGYITTPEEYLTQSYEAGHTVYGRETLRGIIKGFTDLVERMKDPGLAPSALAAFKFTAEELAKRSRD